MLAFTVTIIRVTLAMSSKLWPRQNTVTAKLQSYLPICQPSAAWPHGGNSSKVSKAPGWPACTRCSVCRPPSWKSSCMPRCRPASFSRASSTACKTLSRSAPTLDGFTLHHGRPRPYRRLGRQSAGAALLIASGDGRVVASVRCAQGGRARRGHGTYRRTDRNSHAAKTSCCAAAAWAMRCCFLWPKRCASAVTGSFTLPAIAARTDIFKREEIEQASDQIIWSVDQGPPAHLTRPQDLAFVGNIVQAMQAYAEGRLARA